MISNEQPGDKSDEYDDALDRIVDTQNVSYDDARRILGRPDPNALISSLAASHLDTSPIYGPFGERATQELEAIHDAKYLSDLSGKMAKIAILAINQASPYEVEALIAAVNNRREKLTYPNNPEADNEND